MTQKVTLNNVEFNSKTKAQEYAKTVLNKYTCNDKLAQDDFEFMISYFKHFHFEWERKNGVGIEYLFIRKSEWDNNEFWIQRIDGSITDISYILKKVQKADYKYWIELAFKDAINEDLLAFKSSQFENNEVVICPITKEELTKEEAEVDYEEKTFKSIIADFLTSKELKVTADFFKENQEKANVPDVVDSTILSEFRTFHNENSKLILVSKNANRSLVK